MPDRKTTKLLTWLLPLFLLTMAPGAWSKGVIALVIDDVGYHKNDIDAISLDAPLTYSILPHTPFGAEYAELARKSNKDVMLHIPMEAMSGKAMGPGGISTDMSRLEVETALSGALKEIPYAIGINNHMGSLLTQKEYAMRWTMEFLQRNGMFFLDSKTSNHSVGEQQAQQQGIPALHRNVFIDNILTDKAMNTQLDLLVKIAKKYHRAIGIAHPHPETIKFLAKALPALKQKGITLVPISALLPHTMQLAHRDGKPHSNQFD